MLFQPIYGGKPSSEISPKVIPNLKILVLIILCALGSTSQEVLTIIGESLADAYLQVTIFVAATLFVFYYAESRLDFNVAFFFQRHRSWQVPVAAFMGMLPGCGGAIIVITNYLKGGLSFGTVVAVLTSTMGDAAFLLIAQSPSDALYIFGCTLVVGIVSGTFVDVIHNPTFLRSKINTTDQKMQHMIRRVDSKFSKSLWALPFIPGIFIGIAIAFQFDTRVFGEFLGIDALLWVGILGALISLYIWSKPPTTEVITQKPKIKEDSVEICEEQNSAISEIFGRVLGDTVFITAWVILAFLAYELAVYFFNLNPESIFLLGASFIPLIAILVGFIPGCGAQVMVSSLYLSGTLPFSAEIGNAISNDGDALFPALALNPKVAIVATLYSAIPALIVAYSYYWIFEY